MDDKTATAIRADLDSQLSGRSPKVAIIFSEGLFDEFKRRNWITLENFGVLGTQLFQRVVPAYERTHHAWRSWGIDDFGFLVGPDV